MKYMNAGDPHMTGFRGQKFDFTGADGEWYCLVADAPAIHLNMRVTSPEPTVPQVTYITGISVSTLDADGECHTIVIEVSSTEAAPQENLRKAFHSFI